MKYNFINLEKKITLAAYLIIALFFTFNLYAYVFTDKKLIFPDEMTFLGRAPSFSDHGIKNIIFGENKLGYGAIYWGKVSIFKQFEDFNTTFKGLRFLSFLYLLSIPILFYLIGKTLNTKQFILHSIMLWISFPSSWFFGKIIGPELFSIFLGLYGFYLTLHKKWRYIGFILIGIGVGVKLNLMTVSLFAFQYCLLNKKRNLRYKNIFIKFLKFIFYTVIGIILSTPKIILNPIKYINNILMFGKGQISTSYLNNIFFLRNNFLWDGIHNEGFFNIQISFLLLLFISGAVLLKKIQVENKAFVFCYVIAFFFQSMQITKASRYLEWYWLPLITLTPILFFSVKPNRLSKTIITLFIFFNFCINSSSIFSRIKNKIIHHQILNDRIEIESFISNIEKEYPNYRFFYFTEFWINPLPNFEHYTILHKHMKDHTKNKFKFGKESEKPTILFLGTRFLKMDNKWKKLINDNGKISSKKIQLLNKCNGMHAYLIK